MMHVVQNILSIKQSSVQAHYGVAFTKLIIQKNFVLLASGILSSLLQCMT